MSKKTPLYDKHVEYGGKVIEFGGWLLPVQYKGIIDEHNAVRQRVGLFDVSHMGEFLVEGAQAFDFVQYLLPIDCTEQADQQIQYTPMCYPDGGVVDDLLVYKYSKDKYMLVVNAANIDKDWQWCNEAAAGFDVKLTNLSDTTAELALQGPKAQELLQTLIDVNLEDIKYYWFKPNCTIQGIKALVSRTGYTGEDGFEIYLDPQDAPDMWDLLLKAGEAYGILPTGLGCRDTLRFEASMPLYGHELSATITPLMAGMPRFVKLDKLCDFIGKQALAQQKAEGVKQKVVGLEIIGRGIARAEYPVVKDGQTIGVVTTGSPAPTLGKNLAMALVAAEHAKAGTPLAVEIRGKAVEAVVVPKPFYKRA